MLTTNEHSHRRGLSRLAVTAGLILGSATAAPAQTMPGTANPHEPFEVHGLLYSGSAPAAYGLGDGWAQGDTYRGVLDPDGNPAVDDSGFPFNASRQVDENWGNAGDGFDSTLFAGGNKNSDPIGAGDAPWNWDMGAGGPQKNDITNAYFHTRTDPLTGDRWVFVAAETRSINGDSHADFEFNQAGVVKVGANRGEIIGLGPYGGRTVNDFLVSVDFEQGGEFPVASVRFWNGVAFEEVAAPGGIFSATNFVDIPHGWEGSWKHFTSDGAETNVLTHLQLVEAGINLTALGIMVNPCSTEATFMVKTRSSSSWTADLKDFAIVHFPLEPLPEIAFTSPDEVCNGETFEVSATELTGLPNTTLEWSVSGCGRMASAPIGPTVEVEADAACNCDITLSVTATAGQCAHVVVAERVVRVGDENAPTLSSTPDDLVVECDAVPEPDDPEAADECGIASYDLTEAVDAAVCEGQAIITRTWEAIDGCDNATRYSQTITVADTTGPVLSGVPADAAAACDAVPDAAEVTAADNCSAPEVELSEAVVAGDCPADYTLLRTWTGLDACGNQTAETQTITVYDDQAPALMDVPPDATYECDALPPVAEVSATDNCTTFEVQLEEIVGEGDCEGSSTVLRAWTATDECGNAAVATQTITLQDTTSPVLLGVPDDAAVECDAIPEPAPVSAGDNCSVPLVELTENLTPGPGAGKALIARTWTATDDCGNQTSQSQTLTVVDTTAPFLFDVPEDVVVECHDVPPPADVGAGDNCADPRIELTESEEPGSCEDARTVVRTWTATDDCGNQSSQSQTVTVVDTLAPVILEPPADITAECDAVPAPPEVTASDLCAEPQLSFSESAEPGECQGQSLLTRTWTATDDCGNQTVHAQLLTVVDTTPPILSDDPADITVECDAVPQPPTVTASDNCGEDVSVELDEQTTPGACVGEYALLRTWTSADDCGNDAAVSQVVNVQDTTAPTLALQSPSRQFICDGRPVDFSVTAADNCSEPQLALEHLQTITANSRDRVIVTQLSDTEYRISAPGPAWITGGFTAGDDCGNTAAPFTVNLSATIGRQACSQGFWKNHYDRWGPTGFSPSDSFLDAFRIADLSSPEIPGNFDPQITLSETINLTGGSFGQLLLQGTAALLNAAHPEVDFPATVEEVRRIMQRVFSGRLGVDQARALINAYQAAESECGCPIS